MINRRQFVLTAGAAAILRAVPARGQTLPTTFDWTPLYPADKQRIWGDTVGDCVNVSICYAMEMRNLIQGGAFVQLSELDLDWQSDNGLIGPNQPFGVARESLWPFSLTYPSATIPDPAQARLAALQVPPSAAAVADRANFVCTDYPSELFFDFASFIQYCKGQIFAGFPISLSVPPNHQSVFWGWNDNINCFLGFDNRATSPGIFEFSYVDAWSQGEAFVSSVRAVQFNPVAVIQGNTQMLIDTIKQEANGLVLGQITAAQLATFQANVALLVPDAQTGPPPPSPTTISYGQSLTDTHGNVWTILAAPAGAVKINGQDAGGEWASSLTLAPDGSITVLEQGNGYCRKWLGSGWGNC